MNSGKREPFNLTPNITPIKEIALPEKKVLIRSFSKGNLIHQNNNSNHLAKKIEKNGNGLNKYFIIIYSYIENILYKKPTSALNSIQNILPPKPKKTISSEKEIQENHVNPNWNLTEDEKNIYGDRNLENYEKLDLLGK